MILFNNIASAIRSFTPVSLDSDSPLSRSDLDLIATDSAAELGSGQLNFGGREIERLEHVVRRRVEALLRRSKSDSVTNENVDRMTRLVMEIDKRKLERKRFWIGAVASIALVTASLWFIALHPIDADQLQLLAIGVIGAAVGFWIK